MSDSKEQHTKIKGDGNTVNNELHVHKSNSEVKMPYEDFQRRIKLERNEAVEDYKKASDAEKVKLEQKIAELDLRLADVPKAFQEFKERIARLESMLEREGNEIGNKKLVEARDALEKGDFSKADDLFAEIEAREELAVKRSARAAYARGEIAEQEIRWYDAVEHYTRAAQLDPCFETLLKAQKLTYDIEDYDSSLPFCLDAQKAAIKEYGKDTQFYALIINNLGAIYSKLKEYKLAEPLHKESLKIRQNILGKKHPEVGMSLTNLGGMYQAKNQHREATYFLKRSLNIHKESLGLKHHGTASTLHNLGCSYRDLHNFRKAKPLLKQGLKLRKEILGDNHPETASSFSSLGGFYFMQGQYTKAEPLARQALEILESTLGLDHPRTKQAKINYEKTKKIIANT